jgi:poly-gamma-glutamate synthesis protein (capsule biosynthesis protein)
LTGAFLLLLAAQHVTPPELVDPKRPPARELETRVPDGFTLAAVGDLITSRPLAPLLASDPGFVAVVKILQGADATFGNFENTAFEPSGFTGSPYPGHDDWALIASPGVPADLKALGFDLVSRANNHGLDWGLEGMRESTRLLDSAGLVHAGVGESRADARAARYFESPAGRIGLVSMASSFRDYSEAMPPRGRANGRPGLSALHTTRTALVTRERYEALRAAEAERRKVAEDEAAPVEGLFFEQRFRVGDKPGYAYEMSALDEAEILQAIRQGKQHSDLLVATIHAHEKGLAPAEPADFLRKLAHDAIDAGAGAFVGHGEHTLMPIEIYKGRPIFYSLANFFWSDIQEPLPAELYENNRAVLDKAFGKDAQPTDADLSAVLNATSFNDEKVFQTVIAVTRYAGGRASEVRLYPIDLGYGEPLTRSGIPHPASPEVARAILERLQRISKPFGTEIAIEAGVGVIRPR